MNYTTKLRDAIINETKIFQGIIDYRKQCDIFNSN